MLSQKVVTGIRPTVPEHIDPGMVGLWELIRGCWSHKPSERPPSPKILSQLNAIALAEVNTQNSECEYPRHRSRPSSKAKLLQGNKHQYVASYILVVLRASIFQP